MWIALSRRSNGMTGRSVLGPTPGALRTTEVGPAVGGEVKASCLVVVDWTRGR